MSNPFDDEMGSWDQFSLSSEKTANQYLETLEHIDIWGQNPLGNSATQQKDNVGNSLQSNMLGDTALLQSGRASAITTDYLAQNFTVLSVLANDNAQLQQTMPLAFIQTEADNLSTRNSIDESEAYVNQIKDKFESQAYTTFQLISELVKHNIDKKKFTAPSEKGLVGVDKKKITSEERKNVINLILIYRNFDVQYRWTSEIYINQIKKIAFTPEENEQKHQAGQAYFESLLNNPRYQEKIGDSRDKYTSAKRAHDQSNKGKAARQAYRGSEKWKTIQQVYEQSDRGKTTRQEYKKKRTRP